MKAWLGSAKDEERVRDVPGHGVPIGEVRNEGSDGKVREESATVYFCLPGEEDRLHVFEGGEYVPTRAVARRRHFVLFQRSWGGAFLTRRRITDIAVASLPGLQELHRHADIVHEESKMVGLRGMGGEATPNTIMHRFSADVEVTPEKVTSVRMGYIGADGSTVVTTALDFRPPQRSRGLAALSWVGWVNRNGTMQQRTSSHAGAPRRARAGSGPGSAGLGVEGALAKEQAGMSVDEIALMDRLLADARKLRGASGCFAYAARVAKGWGQRACTGEEGCRLQQPPCKGLSAPASGASGARPGDHPPSAGLGQHPSSLPSLTPGLRAGAAPSPQPWPPRPPPTLPSIEEDPGAVAATAGEPMALVEEVEGAPGEDDAQAAVDGEEETYLDDGEEALAEVAPHLLSPKRGAGEDGGGAPASDAPPDATAEGETPSPKRMKSPKTPTYIS